MDIYNFIYIYNIILYILKYKWTNSLQITTSKAKVRWNKRPK